MRMIPLAPASVKTCAGAKCRVSPVGPGIARTSVHGEAFAGVDDRRLSRNASNRACRRFAAIGASELVGGCEWVMDSWLSEYSIDSGSG